MKKVYILVASLLVSFGSFSATTTLSEPVDQSIKAGVTITVSVKSSDQAVKGALVKLVSERMVIGAGTTDESGRHIWTSSQCRDRRRC